MIAINPDNVMGAYRGLYSEDLPAMISLEDQQIAEILIFGDPKEHPLNSFPVLSLETENNDEYGKGAEGSGYDKAFSYKIYTPQWLAYTDFGRTFWVTDKLIGTWCWNPERFKIGVPEDCASPNLHFMAKNFVKDLRLTGGRSAGGASIAKQPHQRTLSTIFLRSRIVSIDFFILNLRSLYCACNKLYLLIIASDI